jgi:hypothetical protein
MDKNNTLFKENTSFSDFVALNQPICSKTQKEAFKRRRSSSTSSVETLRDMYQNDQQNRQQNRQQSISKLQNNDNTPPSIFESFPYTLYVDNRDSAARDHMANERTYLAWVRTSLSTVSIGVGKLYIYIYIYWMKDNYIKQSIINSLDTNISL